MDTLTICSYPRTGRHWLVFLLANVLAQQQGQHEPVTFPDLPALGVRFEDRPMPPGRAVTVHCSHSREPRAVRAVVLVRNAADTLWSYWHLLTARRGLVIDWPTCLRHQTYGAEAYVAWLNAVASRLTDADTHVVSYEHLHANPAQALADVCTFARLRVTDAELAAAVACSTFDAMQASELEHGMGPGPQSAKIPDGLQCRAGTIGAGQAACSPEDYAYLARVLEGLSLQGLALYAETGDGTALETVAAADEAAHAPVGEVSRDETIGPDGETILAHGETIAPDPDTHALADETGATADDVPDA